MKFGRLGILISGVVAIGALALIVLCPSIVQEAVYPLERIRSFVRKAVRDPENADLRRKVAEQSMIHEECLRLGKENAALRKLLDYRAKAVGEWVPAEVLSFGGGAAATRDVIRVGKGSLSGVREGAAVVVPEGLVGRVVSVSPHTAEVLLLTDPSMRVSCRIEAEDDAVAHGILMGADSDRILLGHLSGAAALRPHAKVVTSGLGGLFPKDIRIGTLLFVTNGVRGVEGEVLPGVDPATLEDVFIRCDR